MIPSSLEAPFNSMIVGKIIEFANNKSGFEGNLKSLDPETVESFTWILRWLLNSKTSLSAEISDWFGRKSEIHLKIEEKFPYLEGRERFNLLEMIKLLFILQPSLVENFTFKAELLRVEVSAIIVEGFMHSQDTHSTVEKMILDHNLIEILHSSDNEQVRITILRTLKSLLNILPCQNLVVEVLIQELVNFHESRFLEAITFILKPLMNYVLTRDCKFNYEDHVTMMIYKGIESDDWMQRKQAIHALKILIQIYQDKDDFPSMKNKSLEIILAIFNALEQNQSHLIIPAINMLPHTQDFDAKWKKLLLRKILKHHQKDILLPTLTHLIEMNDFDEIINDCLPQVFSALNHSSVHQEIPQTVEKFCIKSLKWNWRRFLSTMTEENWQPISLYSMLNYLTKNLDYLNSSIAENNQELGPIVGKIVGNIFNLQVDASAKKEMVCKLFDLMRNIKKFLGSNEIDGVLVCLKYSVSRSQLKEIVSILDTNSDSENGGLLPADGFTLFHHRDLVKDFNENFADFYKCAEDISFEDLFNMFEHPSKMICEESSDFFESELGQFSQLSLKKRLILLNQLKSQDFQYGLNICSDFMENFEEYLNIKSESRDFTAVYERSVLEVILQMVQVNSCDISERIIKMIDDRLDCGQDYCNTVFMFRFLNNGILKLEEKIQVEALLELAYREMMVYKGKAEFATYCSCFIEYFPSDAINIEATMKKLLGHITINSSEIAESISRKLKHFTPELLIELISKRESAFNSIGMKKTSPLKVLQMKILEHVVQVGISSKVLDGLIGKYSKISKSKSMYYPNSSHHLDKLRIIQGIALIAGRQHSWRREYLDFLLAEANQPSILYILEMIVADQIPFDNVHLLFEMLQQPEKIKMHGAQSIFCILYLLCLRMKNQEFYMKCFTVIYPWTMGQNFNCRLYAQIALVKITQLMSSSQLFVKNVHDSIMFSFNHLSGNPKKTLERLNQDFRYNSANVESLLSLTYILRDIPRIAGVIESEIVSDCPGPNDLKEVIHPWQEKHTSADTVRLQETYTNIQTKIVTSVESSNRARRKSNLIVCASLVENYPNLGGLARTCEVFGVNRLLLNSLHDADNAQFAALSMSAEKWLTLEEVKKWQVLDFCAEMKRQGYTIVGAEQTPKSTNLADVKFPGKSLIVLGHEKEGLPADIIALLDIVVEIPQIGCVRSLNVHVTGSIFIYEYAKQHLFHSKDIIT
ncbi:hypothetical protein DMENIID0001_000640 [Sergentomyia squamirostris]